MFGTDLRFDMLVPVSSARELIVANGTVDRDGVQPDEVVTEVIQRGEHSAVGALGVRMSRSLVE